MKIPFSQVRFEKNSDGIWGLQVARIIYRRNETDFWQHVPADAPGFIHIMGEMTGIDGIEPRKIFDVTPYGVAKLQTFEGEEGNPFTYLESGRRPGLNAGLDAKIGVTNNMTMDLTINPDFGQVEADPSEVNLTAYETFFSEKRPFFIEGNNITSFNIGLGDGGQGNDNLFYSRRIGRQPQGYPTLGDQEYADVPTFTTILGAAKVTGKTKNGLSLGFVEGMTGNMWAAVKDSSSGTTIRHELVEPLTNYFLGRVQRDFNEGNTLLGGIITSTNRDLDDELGSFMHKGAYSGGIDFTQFFKEKSWSFNINAALSQVNGSKDAITQTQLSSARYYQRPDNDYTEFDPDRTSLIGSGGRMQLMKLDGHLNIMAVVKWKTPGFEINDLGYQQQADQVLSVFWMGYNVWEPKGIYRRWNLGGDLYLVNNFGGDIIGKGFEWNGNMGFKNYWSAWFGGNLDLPSLSGGILRGGPMMKFPGSINGRFGFRTDYRKKLTFDFFINGSSGFAKNSKSIYTEVEFEYKPTNYLSFSVSPGYSQSFTELQYVGVSNFEGEDRYIFASIDRKTLAASLKVNFNLSPDLTLQYWGQPYVATGDYHDHKYITTPLADEYTDRFHVYTTEEINQINGYYEIDENNDDVPDYSFGNSDFNYQFFLSNLVIRWEYSPGSSLYIVWSQSRNFFNNSGRLDYFSDIGDLFNRDNNIPYNVFLIKFSYRFGLN